MDAWRTLAAANAAGNRASEPSRCDTNTCQDLTLSVPPSLNQDLKDTLLTIYFGSVDMN